MAILKVNPTRMELRRLKGRLKTAERGHKLLKDKSDEMIRRFMEIMGENRRLRTTLEPELSNAISSFSYAKAISDSAGIEEALAMPSRTLNVKAKTANIMSLSVPKIEIETVETGDIFPYSFASVTAELDMSIQTISGLIEKMVRLSEIEKTCDMLASEIEKTKRRVNALEYFLIPQIQETIKYIDMKLQENERGNIVRLMKVKELIKK